MKKTVAIILMAVLAISLTGCGKKEKEIKHIKKYISTIHYSDDIETVTEVLYNEKGLATEMRSQGDSMDFKYDFDEHDNPTKVVAKRDNEKVELTLENDYEGDKLKKVFLTALEYDDRKIDLSKEGEQLEYEPAMYISTFLPLITGYDNYRDVDFECPGTGALIKRSDEKNVYSRTTQQHIYGVTFTEKKSDGSWVETKINGNIENNEYVPGNTTMSTYDKDNKVSEILYEFYDPEITINLYFEYERHDDGDGYYLESKIKDNDAKTQNDEQAVAAKMFIGTICFKYYYDKDDILTKVEKTAENNKDITYYNEDGSIHKSEFIYSETYYSSIEYEYWEK